MKCMEGPTFPCVGQISPGRLGSGPGTMYEDMATQHKMAARRTAEGCPR